MSSGNLGRVLAVRGHIAQVRFIEMQPEMHQILVGKKDPEVRLKVYTSSGQGTFYCMVLSGSERIYRGLEIENTGKQMSIPVGDKVLGRVMDVFGRPADGGEEIAATESRQIFTSSPDYSQTLVHEEIWETGIKVIDFFSPLMKGGKMGLFGGAGVGKTLLLTEMIDNVVRLAQAGNELATLMNMIPSEDGYQATLTSEMAAFHERLVSTDSRIVSAIEAIYVPSDDMLDAGVQSIFPYLDSVVTLSRVAYQEGRLPAVDILTSHSSALSPIVVWRPHYEVAI